MSKIFLAATLGLAAFLFLMPPAFAQARVTMHTLRTTLSANIPGANMRAVEIETEA
jgi:hypothetical protein